MLKWLTVQATSNAPHNVAALREIVKAGTVFQKTNPNSVYSLLLAFSRSAVNFHAADGRCATRSRGRLFKSSFFIGLPKAAVTPSWPTRC